MQQAPAADRAVLQQMLLAAGAPAAAAQAVVVPAPEAAAATAEAAEVSGRSTQRGSREAAAVEQPCHEDFSNPTAAAPCAMGCGFYMGRGNLADPQYPTTK